MDAHSRLLHVFGRFQFANLSCHWRRFVRLRYQAEFVQFSHHNIHATDSMDCNLRSLFCSRIHLHAVAAELALPTIRFVDNGSLLVRRLRSGAYLPKKPSRARFVDCDSLVCVYDLLCTSMVIPSEPTPAIAQHARPVSAAKHLKTNGRGSLTSRGRGSLGCRWWEGEVQRASGRCGGLCRAPATEQEGLVRGTGVYHFALSS